MQTESLQRTGEISTKGFSAFKHSDSYISGCQLKYIYVFKNCKRSVGGPPLKLKKAEGNTQWKGKGSQETIVVSFQLISIY